MSVLTERRQQVRSASTRRAAPTQRPVSRPYITVNGATMVSIAAIALTVIGLLYLIQTSQVASLGYDMSRLQTQRDALSLEISELEYELARYEALHTVEQIAEERLGMTRMSNYAFIEVQEPAERNLTVPEQEKAPSQSLAERVVNAILGIGSANSASSQSDARAADEVAP
jgi:cell division protein FtsL